MGDTIKGVPGSQHNLFAPFPFEKIKLSLFLFRKGPISGHISLHDGYEQFSRM
jgi:hypothetical protein